MKKNIFLFAFLTAFTLIFDISCSKNNTDNKPVIAITTFDGKGIDFNDVEFVMNTFTTSLANLGMAKIVDRGSFDKLKGNLSFQASDWTDSKKVAGLGKALNATHVVVGQLMKRDYTYFLTVKILDVNTSTIISSYMDRVESLDDFFERMPEFCEKLIANMADSKAFSSVIAQQKDLIEGLDDDKKTFEETIPKATSNSVMEYDVGDEGEGGGIVFYVSKKGFTVHDGMGKKKICHYLEMSVTTLGESSWFPEYSEVGTKNDLGYGKSNTYRILHKSRGKKLTEVNCAAYRCSLYFTPTTKAGDWFLPSKDELYLMWENMRESVLTSYEKAWYWSSSEVNKDSSEFISFYNVDDLIIEDLDKIKNKHAVRAIRAF